MKLALRTLVLGIVAVGASAAIGSSYKTLTNHSSAIPVPTCNPGHPCGNGSGK